MSIVDGASLKDERLRGLYQRSPGPVVFIDESLREPGRGERPFYSTSGVMIAKDQGDMIRQSTVEIAGSDYWHTTEAFASNLGKHDCGNERVPGPCCGLQHHHSADGDPAGRP